MSESTVAAAFAVPPHRRWDATEEDAMDGRTQASDRQQRPRDRPRGRGGGRPKEEGEGEGGRQEERIIVDRPTADRRRLGPPLLLCVRLLFLLVFYSIDLR